MSGTAAGAKKAARTNKRKYGLDFYARIGKRGGALGHTGGFASYKVGKDGLTGWQRATVAGQAGGKRERMENFFILDEAPFDEGFNESAWDKTRRRLLRR